MYLFHVLDGKNVSLMFHRIKYLVLVGIIGSIGLVTVLYGAGRYLARPAPEVIGAAKSYFSIEQYPFKSLTFADERGRDVAAWVAEGQPDKGALILIHGIRSNRLSMIDRARMLYTQGFSVLMIDLQAHGESQGEQITFGLLEALSAEAAIRFTREQWPGKKVGLIGVSLGGASAVFASSKVQADAYILEAVFSTLSEAAENRVRIRFGELGAVFTPLLLWQTQIQLGVRVEEISPLKYISHIKVPIFLIAGEKDDRTTLENSLALYERISGPKSKWIIPGAKHQDFYKYAGKDYKIRVLEFLEKNLAAQN